MSRLAMLLTATLILALVPGAIGCGGGEQEVPTQGVPSAPQTTIKPTPEPITLKLITSAIEGTPRSEIYFHFAELVEQYTDGQVLIDVYPGSQLFPATEQWEAVATGAVDVFGDSTYYISRYVPDVMIAYIDGLFESYEHAYAVLEDSEVPQILAQKTEEAGPVKMLGILPGSMAICVLNSIRETDHLEDLKGLRTQSSPGAPPLPFFDYTGLVGVPISYEETSTAFIQGVLDAVYFPPNTMRDLRFYETGKHALCRYSLFTMEAMIVNEDSWNSLPADIQDIVLNEVMPAMYEFAKKFWREEETTSLEILEQKLETVNWVTQEENDAYLEFTLTHPVRLTQLLMVDPKILDIIEDLRPSKQ